MSRISRLDYAYAVGRVRALENLLVAKPFFMEAAEEKNLSSALKIIFDAGQFHQEKIEIEDSEQLDGFLEKEESALLGLVSSILHEKEIERIVLDVDQPDKALEISQELKVPFITKYLRYKIDLGNLKMLCRAKYLELSLDRLVGLFLEGGFLDVNFFLESFDLSYGEIGEKLLASAFHSAWILATDELVENETFIVLEREFENFLMIYLRKAKYIVFGPEPVFAYAQAKKKELQLLRLLGVGILNQIPAEILKQRMSETYV
ncbi:MAG: V-type ATPase subunit [Candidatus Aminicenantes bacterium]|nr:MAG: V-type ATPase subunit [Candidatus Aminicenantes bacterium]